jgi:hypothetical protein
MPWTHQISDDGKTLKVKYEGTFVAGELRQATEDILSIMLEKKIMRVLLDCYDAHFDVPIIGVYQLPDLYEARGIPRKTRAAVILPKDHYRQELYEFYEDVCSNRGYFVKLFEDAAEAWKWLQES